MHILHVPKCKIVKRNIFSSPYTFKLSFHSLQWKCMTLLNKCQSKLNLHKTLGISEIPYLCINGHLKLDEQILTDAQFIFFILAVMGLCFGFVF